MTLRTHQHITDKIVDGSINKGPDKQQNNIKNIINTLELKGYEVLQHSDTDIGGLSEYIAGCLWLSSFLCAWIGSLLYPVLVVLLYLTGCWPFGIILSIEWYLIRVVFKDYTESDQFRNSYFASFIRNKFSRIPGYIPATISILKQDRENIKIVDPSIYKGDNPTLYAVHPHGIFSIGWSYCSSSLSVSDSPLQDVRFIFDDVLYSTPLFFVWSNIFRRHGGVRAERTKEYMNDRENVAIVIGGFEEATIHTSTNERLWLNNRKGFVALAMRYGYNICPVFSFGERKTYWNCQYGLKFRLWLNSWKIPGVIPLGRWPFLPLLPRKDSFVHIVIGSPLQLPQKDNPSREDVDIHHKIYMNKLKSLYEELVPHLDPEAGPLEIW